MATRGRKPGYKQHEKAREKIQVTQIINRLQNFALGVEGVEMTPARVKACQILLAKKMPDLTASDITTHQEDRSFEEIRTEMVGKFGEDLTALQLGEITPDEYARRVAARRPKLVVSNVSNG